MGGRRGYGPTHSQTLEKHFLGAPGLIVLTPCALGDPGRILFEAILHGEDPTLFIENKLLYLCQVQPVGGDLEFEIQELDGNPSGQPGFAPTYLLRVRQAPTAVLTVATYGYMLELVRQAALELAYEHEVFVEIAVPTRLAPIDAQPIIVSAGRTGRLVTVEEGTHVLGWGAEILALAAEHLGSKLAVCERVAALDLPIPSSKPLEEQVLPGVEQIVQTCLRACGRR
jgi:acetoin:2,6-dichlorophenolindophenol oxidoreductase subunit beta